MRGKLLFVVGLGAGYVFGARAGRSAYDAIVAKAKGTAGSPAVQDALHKAGSVAQEKAPKATSAVQSVAQTATETADAAKQAGSAPEKSSPTEPAPASNPAPTSLATDESDESETATA